jgi:prolyl oligopeptidase
MVKIIAILTVLMCVLVIVPGCGSKAMIEYPAAKTVDQVDDYFGKKVADPYRWLEEMDTPDTKAWVEAQVKVTDDYLGKIPFRDDFKKRFTAIWNYERYTIPRKEGKYYVFKKNDGLQEHSVVYIQEGLDGEPKVLLDPNTFSEDGSVSLVGYSFSRDYKYVAYGISRGGSDWREYYVIEVETGKKLEDQVQWIKFSGVDWYKDGFFYSRYDKPEEGQELKASNVFHKMYYHKLGTPQADDVLVHQDTENPKIGFDGEVSESGRYLMIVGWEGASNENLLFYKDLKKDSPVLPIVDKTRGRFTFVGELDGRILIQTDYKAPNFRLISIDPALPAEDNWLEIVPESTNAMGGVSFVGGRLIARYLQDASSQVVVYDVAGKKLYDVALPGIGSVGGFIGKPDHQEVFYEFSSLNYPPTIFRYDIKGNRSEIFKKPDTPFSMEDYVTERVFYKSKDGTKVPMFLAHKKGIQLDGRRPTLLYAYGGFNSSMTPYFRGSIIPLLENGGVYAVACLRGGSEYGETWHRDGMLEKKQNVFDDFIAAAEYLQQKKYTSKERLAIYGGSNGGLLVGAVINQRPELYRVAIPAVGVMDMLRYHKFTIGWAWAPEYGSSDNQEQFEYLIKYSPLHNIDGALDYPATLVTTADHDDRVFPAHSFKYIATLQEKYKGDNPVLVRIETKVGHGAGTSTSRSIEYYSDLYSFIFHNMGITPEFK